jgi:hypothetical protein
MKEGASDPFADDEPEPTETADEAGDTRTETDSSDPVRSLPYIHSRDTVKEDRPNVHQLFVRDDTDREAKHAEMELEDILGEDVYRLDAREAIYLAGMQNLGDAADLLREWGYDWE